MSEDICVRTYRTFKMKLNSIFVIVVLEPLAPYLSVKCKTSSSAMAERPRDACFVFD